MSNHRSLPCSLMTFLLLRQGIQRQETTPAAGAILVGHDQDPSLLLDNKPVATFPVVLVTPRHTTPLATPTTLDRSRPPTTTSSRLATATTDSPCQTPTTTDHLTLARVLLLLMRAVACVTPAIASMLPLTHTLRRRRKVVHVTPRTRTGWGTTTPRMRQKLCARMPQPFPQRHRHPRHVMPSPTPGEPAKGVGLHAISPFLAVATNHRTHSSHTRVLLVTVESLQSRGYTRAALFSKIR